MVMDRKAWHATLHGVTKSWTQLSDRTELKGLYDYFKDMYEYNRKTKLNFYIWKHISEMPSTLE